MAHWDERRRCLPRLLQAELDQIVKQELTTKEKMDGIDSDLDATRCALATTSFVLCMCWAAPISESLVALS